MNQLNPIKEATTQLMQLHIPTTSRSNFTFIRFLCAPSVTWLQGFFFCCLFSVGPQLYFYNYYIIVNVQILQCSTRSSASSMYTTTVHPPTVIMANVVVQAKQAPTLKHQLILEYLLWLVVHRQ